MLDDEDDFDIEDVDLSCFNQNLNNVVSSKQSFCVTRPQKKIVKKHALDFVKSFVDETPSNPTIVQQVHHELGNDTLSKKNNSPRNVLGTRRKFPGPAGLLPTKANVQSTTHPDSKFSSDSCANNTRDKHDIEQASSQCGSIFETIAWKCALQDIEQSGFSGINSCNVSHLKRFAFSTKSKALKYPFLLLAVTNMNTGQELFASLRDSTGEIQAHINSEVLEQYPTKLNRGSVIVLKKVGVLKTGQARGVSLLITPNNLAVIYPPDSGISKLSLLKSSCQDVDLSNLDISLNHSLDTSLNNISSEPSFNPNRTPTPNLERRNQCSHSTPNSHHQRRFTSMSTSNRSSTPNIDHFKRTDHNSLPVRQSFQQPVSSNQKLSANSSLECDKQKLCTFQSSSNLNIQSSENNLSNLVYNKSGRGPDKSITKSVLTQSGINQGEDLSSTVNSLFEGLDTDSIFDDF